MIWLSTVWTGLNEDIGSWKISAISAPRIDRISGPFGDSFARSTMRPSSGRPSPAGPRNSLLPRPLSPTMPSVAPGYRSRSTPSTAFTVPSSWEKYVFRFRTDRSGRRESARFSSAPIGIRSIAQSIAEEVEGHDGDDDRKSRDHQPRRDGHGLDILGLLEQDTPA